MFHGPVTSLKYTGTMRYCAVALHYDTYVTVETSMKLLSIMLCNSFNYDSKFYCFGINIERKFLVSNS